MAYKVELKIPRVSYAKRYLEILNNPDFVFFPDPPATLEEEKDWIRKAADSRKKGKLFVYSIFYDDKLVGGCGITIHQSRMFIGEIGYFIDEAYWGKGIAAKAVRKLEKIGFKEIGLKRIEILMNPKNIASERVAIKCGYQKEGLMRKAIETNGKLFDALLYAKVK